MIIKPLIVGAIFLLLSGCIGTLFSKHGRDLNPGETIPRLHEVPDKGEIVPLPRAEMAKKEKELRAHHHKEGVSLGSPIK
ncbi:MAG: hypothetical protein H6849_01270 [Alphaproteobacteria bacterium]|nr:MAG: hypothetical protein H6849_01270 [Alphaproteobacteria bacterium]